MARRGKLIVFSGSSARFASKGRQWMGILLRRTINSDLKLAGDPKNWEGYVWF